MPNTTTTKDAAREAGQFPIVGNKKNLIPGGDPLASVGDSEIADETGDCRGFATVGFAASEEQARAISAAISDRDRLASAVATFIANWERANPGAEKETQMQLLEWELECIKERVESV